ncbi:MAG: X-Pro dipeptidyl-peptidase domain protein [Actinomycetia bacterium]|nr:X-Pro dipeptidyl-peptidase domain protein [Actinomycetes bacterium]
MRLTTPVLHLPRVRINTERGLRVPMPDGTILLADRYAPAGADRPPTILVRTPYGRRGASAMINGLPFAYLGFQVLVQSVRGTFGSGGEFDPLGDEREDGLATVEWLKKQDWFGGTFATYGPSYLGYTAWAIAAEAGPELKAMAAQITASSFRDAAYVGGAFALESTLTWADLTARQERPLGMVQGGLLSKRRAMRAARSGRPLSELDMLTNGATMPFFQDLLANQDPNSPYWDKRDFTATVGQVDAAVTLLGGWYDVFLPWLLKDYLALRAAGRRPYLTIGPWWHADARHLVVSTRESLAWFRAHLLDDYRGLRANPVRVYVTGAGVWREFKDWPVPGARTERWHLEPGGGLGERGPLVSAPGTYRYDPADPTPSLGGPTLLGSSKPVDHRPLESRDDVLLFTSQVLRADLDVIGPVAADLYVRSSREHTDFVVRLCDVAPDGVSLNVCEGGLRLVPGSSQADGDGVRRVRVEMWPTGHRFQRGHRLRVHVASGAHPKVALNPGSGEPLGSAVTLLAAEQEIFHDPDRPSAILLPVVS